MYNQKRRVTEPQDPMLMCIAAALSHGTSFRSKTLLIIKLLLCNFVIHKFYLSSTLHFCGNLTETKNHNLGLTRQFVAIIPCIPNEIWMLPPLHQEVSRISGEMCLLVTAVL